jgi:hypothetical protein
MTTTTLTQKRIANPTQKKRVLEILEQANGRWVDGMSFLRLDSPITQYHARIFDLQEEGFQIEGRFIEGRNWKEYRLLPKDTLF